MRGERKSIACARCDAGTDPASAKFCNRCRVFLCPACARKRQCPSKDPSHRPRVPLLPRAALMGALMAVLMLPIGGLLFAVQEGGRAYAEMPVTPVASLAAGTTAKVSGTMGSPASPVISWTGSSRSGHWVVSRFNVTDATGTVLVDVTRINGEDSTRIVQSGVHGGQWWPGDPVSVTGDVRLNDTGDPILLATRVARSPTSFYRPDVEALALLLGTGGVGAAVAVAALWARARTRREHAAQAPTYAYRWTDWRVCANCGDRVARGEPHCPVCGAASLREPVRDPRLDRLPKLELRTHPGGLPVGERVFAVIFALVVPAILLVAAAWLALLPGLAYAWLLLVFMAIVFLLAAGMTFLKRTQVLLGGDMVAERGLGRSRQVPTREIDRVLTIRQPTRVVHWVMNRGGQWVSFGPGLRPADLEASTRWVRDLAQVAGIPHRETDSLAGATFVLYRDR